MSIISHSSNVQEVKQMTNNSNNSMKMRVPGAKQAIEKMKYEIANEFGVNLGPDATSRANGSVGGEITRRLVQNGMNQVSGSYQNK
jgi:small acid-soluble spore protein A (major alpha-type SASP)